jgi:hypothetical protein
LNKISLNPRRLFLIDGFGALLSAFLLGVVLVKFESTFGMPKKVLYALSLMACLFAIYSFTCYLQVKKNWPPFLKVIAIVNLSYCALTLGLLFYFHQELTSLGMIYFLLEIGVVTSLAIVELYSASKLSPLAEESPSN